MTDFHDYSDRGSHCTCYEYVTEDLLRVIKNLLPLAEAYHKREFDYICDHKDDCSCDQEVQVLAIISEAQETINDT